MCAVHRRVHPVARGTTRSPRGATRFRREREFAPGSCGTEAIRSAPGPLSPVGSARSVRRCTRGSTTAGPIRSATTEPTPPHGAQPGAPEGLVDLDLDLVNSRAATQTRSRSLWLTASTAAAHFTAGSVASLWETSSARNRITEPPRWSRWTATSSVARPHGSTTLGWSRRGVSARRPSETMSEESHPW